jgi:HEAT repeat protein
VAALDDVNSDVRAAALDALTDLRDPATLPAIVVRLHDTSLHRGRRIAALTAFGSQCESFLLDLSAIDDEHLVNYARALGVCGTAESRGTLTRWTEDPRADVRTAALEALARIGLDGNAARHAVDALDSADVPVRAMAAHALRGWPAAGTVAPRLARHLDDAWPVAVHAARSLQSMGEAGRLELQARAGGSDLAGRLARQMMWQGVMR